jgi:histidinol-phosphatase (PHP family)
VTTYKTNYHTHTTWCDGRSSPEEMAEAAIAKGFHVLGFSAHAMFPFAAAWHLGPKHHKEYAAAIAALKTQYASRLPILAGYEADYLPPLAYPKCSDYVDLGADYLIGSVHYLTKNGNPDAGGVAGWFEVDNSAEAVTEGIRRLFHGDGKLAVQCYYDQVRQMIRHSDFAILGHVDLIRKRNGILHFFDENDAWYKSEIQATAEEAAKRGVIVEINTGAIARGAMDDLYPSQDFLQRLHRLDVPIMINSDAHHVDHLDVAFDRAEERARAVGYKAAVYLDAAGKVRENPFLDDR